MVKIKKIKRKEMEGFYGRFGYVTTNNYLKVKIPTHALEHHLPAAADLSGGWTLSRHPAKDSRHTFLPFLYDHVTQYHGFVLYHPEIEDRLLARFWKDQHIILVKQNDRIEAAARYQVEGALTDGVLTVHEMFWRSLAARDKLLGYFARHADATPACWLNVPFGTNFQRWLNQPAVDFEAKISYINLMGRVVDVTGACDGLPAAPDGDLCFVYEDDYCPWNNGRYRLTAHKGTLHAEKTESDCELKLTTRGLSALIYGALPVAELIHRGWATAISEPAQSLLSQWFPPLLAFNINHF